DATKQGAKPAVTTCGQAGGCHVTEGTDYHAAYTAKHTSPSIRSCFGPGCHAASKSITDVHALYVGAGSENPQYATTCALCHDNDNASRVDWTKATAKCSTCHAAYHGVASGQPKMHQSRDAAHTPTSASADCTGCHSLSLPEIHLGLYTTQTDCVSCHAVHPSNGPCATCHALKDTYSKTADCASCHTSGSVHQAVHDVTLSAGCTGTGCHSGTALTGVHSKSTCITCHGSTDALVVAAIAGNVKACDACHASVGHEALHVSSLATECVDCHSSNVTTEHVTNRGFTCATCHQSGNAAVLLSVATKDKSCVGCHGAAGVDHSAFHTTTFNSASCGGCHQSNLMTEHTTNRAIECARCHNNPGSPVYGQAIAWSQNSCADCHSAAHGQALVGSVPSAIPLEPNFTFSAPMSADLFSAEPWMPSSFLGVGARMVVSNRVQTTADGVWAWYSNALAASGWTIESGGPPDPGGTAFSATFVNGNRHLILWCYGGEDHAAAPLSAAGYRVELSWYEEVR
ncbi:MAG: cytochrome c3 family protein, partial [Actinomycetes bacterium]